MQCNPDPPESGVSLFFINWGDDHVQQFPPSYFSGSIGMVKDYPHTYRSPGTYTAELECKDNHYTWSEWDSKEVTITPSTKPDLIVEKLEWDGTPVEGKDLIVKASIKNIGPVKIGQDVQVDFFYSGPTENKGNIGGFSRFPQPESIKIVNSPVEPNQVKEASAIFSPDKAGWYKIKVVVDSIGKISESKEYNNELEKDIQFLVPAKPAAKASIKNERIFSAGVNSFIILKGTEIIFEGSGQISGGSIVKYRWDFDGDGKFDSVLDSGGTKYYLYDKPGTYKAKFVVESKEGYTDEVLFTIKVLDVYVEFEIEPSSTINEGQTIKMWYTIHNKGTKDLNIKSASLLWDYDRGDGFRPENWEETHSFTGIVSAGKSKVLWEKTEEAEYPGKWRGNVIIETQFGDIKTSLIKTILGIAEKLPGSGTVSFNSDKQNYALGDKAILFVSTDITNAEFCDWFYKIGDADWVLVPDRAYLASGKGTFTQTIGQDNYYLSKEGTYEAYALCSNKNMQLGESNVIEFTVVL